MDPVFWGYRPFPSIFIVDSDKGFHPKIAWKRINEWKVSKYGIFSGSYSVRMQENMDHEKLCIWTLHAVNPSNISILANKSMFYSPKTTLKQSTNSYINNKNTRTAPMGVLSNVFIVNFDLEISQWQCLY